jgi:molybdenum cofactor biosynthesis enzyme MoaA
MIKYNVNACDQICNELQIHFTKSCPNKCPFCIDATNKGLDTSSIPQVDKIYEKIELYKGNIESVCISGGEPMLFMEQLIELVRLIKGNTNLKVYIISSIPDICYKNKWLFYEILEKCDGLSISPQHYKEDVADKMRGHESSFDRQTFYGEMPHKEKITVNINMVKPFLCEKSDIIACIKHYNDLGFKDIKLVELFNMEDMYVNFEGVFGMKMKSPFAHGCKTEFDITPWIPSYKGKFTLKRTCFLVNKLLHANMSDMLKAATRKLFEGKYYFGVVYEDGSIHPYWV